MSGVLHSESVGEGIAMVLGVSIHMVFWDLSINLCTRRACSSLGHNWKRSDN